MVQDCIKHFCIQIRPRNRAIFQGPAQAILFISPARPGPARPANLLARPVRPGLNTDYTCTFKNDIRIIEFYDYAHCHTVWKNIDLQNDYDYH